MIFRRQVIVQFGQPGEEGREFTDLRISGIVEKTLGGEPNTARVDIVNPSDASVGDTRESGTMIRVLAGYDVPRLIFQGHINPDGVEIEQNGADRILKIEAQDGGRQFRDAHIEESFSTEMNPEQVFGVIADAMGLPLGVVDLEDDVRWSRGICISAPARDALDELTSAIGAVWSIQDGDLQIVMKGADTGETAVVLSTDNGNLVGRPKPQDDGLEMQALLDGRIRPGRRVVLESRDFEGTYRVRSVNHDFDSGHDANFYTTVLGREV